MPAFSKTRQDDVKNIRKNPRPLTLKPLWLSHCGTGRHKCHPGKNVSSQPIDTVYILLEIFSKPSQAQDLIVSKRDKHMQLFRFPWFGL